MHIVFINHMPWEDTYGASTALRLTVEALRCHRPDIKLSIIASPSVRSLSTEPDEAVNLIHHGFPMEMSYVGGLPQPQKALWNALKRRQVAHIADQAPPSVREVLESADIVHLNSMTLAWASRPLRRLAQRPDLPVMLHVREFLEPNPSTKSVEALYEPDGILLIDSTVKDYFASGVRDYAAKPNWILPDIIATKASIERAASARHEPSGRLKLAVTGRLDPIKGAAFAAELMNRPESVGWDMDVVGHASSHVLRRGPRRQLRRVQAVVQQSGGRVRYLGEIPDLMDSGFYGGIDILLRADPSPAVGLNVYEALACGAAVVLVGGPHDFENYPRIMNNLDRIAFAEARDTDSYIKAIQSLAMRPRMFEYAALRSEIGALEEEHVNTLVMAYDTLLGTPLTDEGGSPQ